MFYLYAWVHVKGGDSVCEWALQAWKKKTVENAKTRVKKWNAFNLKWYEITASLVNN